MGELAGMICVKDMGRSDELRDDDDDFDFDLVFVYTDMDVQLAVIAVVIMIASRNIRCNAILVSNFLAGGKK